MHESNDRNHLIIAGTNKSGTTAIFRYLGDHPSVALSKYKELGFFLQPVEECDGEILESYDSKFLISATVPQLLVEATPQYLHGGSKSATRISAVIPDALVLFVLRNPTDRVLSYYRSSTGQQDLPTYGIALDQFVSEAVEAMQVSDADVNQLPYRQRAFRQELNMSCYAKFLGAYVGEFGADGVLVTFFDQLRSSPRELMNEICAFADIDPSFYDNFVFRVENQTRVHRSAKLQVVSGSLNTRLEPLLNRYPVVRRAARDVYDMINVRPGQDVSISHATRQQLDNFFAPWNEKLADWISETYPEKPLPDWLQR